MSKYTIGLDFGTNSCRSLIVNIENGQELASYTFNYPSGESGIIVDKNDPNLARQNPADYIEGIEVAVKESLKKAKENFSDFSNEDVIGIGIDTTSSSIIPVDREGIPLSYYDKFKNNPAAYVWLWKDHTSYEEAEKITELAAKLRPEYLAKIGGVYSSEWFWSKIWNCQRNSPEVFNAAYSFVEICDWIPAHLTGELDPVRMRRSLCAAGHKALYNKEWGGLPDKEFLFEVSPTLSNLKEQLYTEVFSSDTKNGNISKEWALRLGLSEETVISVGSIDAHSGAVGAGIKEGTMVKILGTSSCDIFLYPNNSGLNEIPGVSGIVDGSVIPGYYGIEAGQPAVGDIFFWYVNTLVPDKFGISAEEKFVRLEKEASRLKPGETGLLALDWNNGNRTFLKDDRLSGLLLGQTLSTQSYEIYKALVEAAAFGALAIIDRIKEYGVKINDIIACGGPIGKNQFLMQIYADITGRQIKISKSNHASALGSAIIASVAAGKEKGGYTSIEEAQKNMTGIDKEIEPDFVNNKIYLKIYKLYKQLHDSFGIEENKSKMFNVMKDLLNLRDQVKGNKISNEC